MPLTVLGAAIIRKENSIMPVLMALHSSGLAFQIVCSGYLGHMRLWEVSDGWVLQEGHAETQLGMETVLRKF